MYGTFILVGFFFEIEITSVSESSEQFFETEYFFKLLEIGFYRSNTLEEIKGQLKQLLVCGIGDL